MNDIITPPSPPYNARENGVFDTHGRCIAAVPVQVDYQQRLAAPGRTIAEQIAEALNLQAEFETYLTGFRNGRPPAPAMKAIPTLKPITTRVRRLNPDAWK